MSQQLNIYDKRMLIAALEQCYAPKRFLLDTFFKKVKTFLTTKVDIDIKQGDRNIAAYVHPLEGGRLVENAGFETRTIEPCYTKEFKMINPNDTVTRLFGEDYSAPMTPSQREQRLLGEKLTSLDERIVRLEELMAAQALVNGFVYVKGVKNDYKVDLGYTQGRQKIVLSGDSCWDKGGDPMFDLDEWAETIAERSGLAPTIIVMGRKVLRALYNNQKIKDRLDIRNFNVGEISTATSQVLPGGNKGVIYHGSLAPSNIPIYTYNEKYRNPVTDKIEPLIPDDTVLMGSESAGCIMLYGMIQNLHSLEARPRFPHTWIEPDGRARYIQLESAPLPNLYQVDAFISARVLSN